MDSEEEIHPILAFILKEGQRTKPHTQHGGIKLINSNRLTENVLYFGLALDVKKDVNIALFF